MGNGFLYCSNRKYISCTTSSSVLIHYEGQTYEVAAYELLKANNVQSLSFQVICSCDLALEAIGTGCRWNVLQDHRNAYMGVYESLGGWFKRLHQIEFISYQGALPLVPVYSLILEGCNSTLMDDVREICDEKRFESAVQWLNKMLCGYSFRMLHNDFCYKNMLINKENQSMMFDFDRSGFGIPEHEVIAIQDRLSNREYGAFLDGYGHLDSEAFDIARVIDHVETIVYATGFEVTPNWARDAIWFFSKFDRN